jgi:signal transduction histidine kinase
MLSTSDLWLIFVTTLVVTAVVTAVALVLVRVNRRGSLASQFVIVLAATILAIGGSTWAVAREMLFPAHELTVLVWILGAAALITPIGAWLVTRSGRRAVGSLSASLDEVASGGVVQPTTGWREFADLSARLAVTSERLAAARAELEQADATRREFFAWISHDLRTPLAGMRVLAEALEAGTGDPRSYVRQIQAQVDNMTRLVDDLFELSRLQSGAFRLTRESVALLDVVSDAVMDVREIADARRIQIVHAGMEGHVLWADPHELTRVVVNLLSNAIRHAPAGTEVLVSADRGEDGHLILVILDRGAGVAVEDLGRMFEVGWRGDTARTAEAGRASAGGGLGLAIVRGIVEAHGGAVSAEHVDEGFQLRVTLPTAP